MSLFTVGTLRKFQSFATSETKPASSARAELEYF
jgi:hypothetical protein